jgi:hypothetical protein
MDSDDSNISDHVGDLDIQPYQFEPLCNDESQQEREYSTSEDSGLLFKWQDSHYQYQYGCSTNKSQMGLKVFRF